jgi:hypothetical protein
MHEVSHLMRQQACIGSMRNSTGRVMMQGPWHSSSQWSITSAFGSTLTHASRQKPLATLLKVPHATNLSESCDTVSRLPHLAGTLI